MKNALIIIPFMLFAGQAQSQQSNFIGTIKYHLNVLRTLENGKSRLDYRGIMTTARFMEKLTSIPSSADGNYFGQDQPNSTDLARWTNWLEINYKFQYWGKYELAKALWMNK